MEAKLPEIEVGYERIVAHNKAEFVQALRNSKGEDGRYDRLADFLGCSLDEDPFGFWIAANIRYWRRDFGKIMNQEREEPADLIDYYMKHYPNATRRAISYVAKNGDYFYEKYGAERVWEDFDDQWSAAGVTLEDLFELRDSEDAKAIVTGNSDFKNRIVWEIIYNWMNDLCECEELTDEDVAAVCGDE